MDTKTMDDVARQMIGKCICALGEFAVNPVIATIKHFREDYEAAIGLPARPQQQPAPQAEQVAGD
jgi:NADH-quinone oxidoreductase subunit F